MPAQVAICHAPLAHTSREHSASHDRRLVSCTTLHYLNVVSCIATHCMRPACYRYREYKTDYWAYIDEMTLHSKRRAHFMIAAYSTSSNFVEAERRATLALRHGLQNELRTTSLPQSTASETRTFTKPLALDLIRHLDSDGWIMQPWRENQREHAKHQSALKQLRKSDIDNVQWWGGFKQVNTMLW